MPKVDFDLKDYFGIEEETKVVAKWKIKNKVFSYQYCTCFLY